MTVSRSRATRVLIADDDAVIRDLLRDLLEREPDLDVVAVVSDGARALALARTLDPDVLVLDEQMPGARGSAVARALAYEGRSVPVVIYTADDSAHDRVRSVAGVSVVAKDAKFEVLLAAIRSAAWASG
jgi:DNA-binding NarL/FixJ family response regulator